MKCARKAGQRAKIFLFPARLDFILKTISMRKVFFILILLPAFLQARETSLSGIVENGQGQLLRITAHDDFISKKSVTLGSSKIESDGSFSIAFDLEETICAYLDINYQRTEIFLEPGEEYILDIRYNPENHLVSYFDRQDLVFEFRYKEAQGLNQLIWQFNEMYNTFVMENFEHVVKLHDHARVEKFRSQVEETFSNVENTYFRNYIKYKFADIEQFARLKGEHALAKEYLAGKPVLYRNVEYTFFFDEFFQKFLTTSPDVITISDLIIAVNDHASNEMILEALAGVAYLNDPGLRELVLIHGLKNLYYNGTYKKPQLLDMIRDIHASTQNAMHKRITSNLLETLTHLSPGSPAPDLRLTGIAGPEFNLKNIKGKAVLLTFFRSGQKGMKNAFDRLAELYSYYRAGLEIISVSLDNDPAAYLPLANSGGYNWTFAHYGNNPEVFDLYNIRDLPMYVLIDVEGNIASCPAPPPGDELERELMKVIH
jgi:hypothetical protein